MDKMLGVFNCSKLQSTSSSDSDIEQRLKNWSIPKVDVPKLYSKGLFDFTRDSSVKTFEHTMTLKSPNETLFLHPKDWQLRWRNKKNKFLHYGLVQVAVKPVHGLGLDSPILLCLFDSRCLRFEQSLLATVESNLQNGPVFFNYRASYPVLAADPHVFRTLTLNIQTKNIDFQENPSPLALIYRIYYKVTGCPLDPESLNSPSFGETQFYEGDFRSSNAFIPRKISWDQVTSSSSWNLPLEETEST